MAQTTRNEPGRERSDLAAAAMDRGREQLENAKGQLAEGAERVAAAVERTAEELEGDGEGAISGFGRSVASLTRQLAGGLRERDIEEFARELATLARRNPGVFLAGSVALGFGIARFFKAHTPSASSQSSRWNGDARRVPGDAWQEGRPDAWPEGGQQYSATDREHDAEDGLDLSAASEWQDGSASTQRGEDTRSEWSASSDAQSAKAQRNYGAEDAGEQSDAASGEPSPTKGPETTSGGKQ
jgi:hypothetical protein